MKFGVKGPRVKNSVGGVKKHLIEHHTHQVAASQRVKPRQRGSRRGTAKPDKNGPEVVNRQGLNDQLVGEAAKDGSQFLNTETKGKEERMRRSWTRTVLNF